MADPTYFQGGIGTGAASTVGGDLFAQARLLYNNANVVTTADDTTTTLLASDYEDILATGTGILHWFDLGDATTYSVGKRFRFRNASTEIIGIKNSDSTTWRRLPPRWELLCVLTNNGSAAGTWVTALRPRITPNAGLYLLDDFMGESVANCSMGWLTAISGVGALVLTGTSAYEQQQGYGYCRIEALNSYSQMYTRSSLLTTNCVNTFQCLTWISSLAVIGDQFIVRIGFGDSTDMSDHTDGIYFEYDYGTNGNVWSLNTAAAGSRTETVTATVPGIIGSPQALRIEVASDASRADYWADRVHLGTVTTDIPGASDSFGVHAGMIKTVGTTSRNQYFDYIALGRYPTTERA
jgi:hypothetical protein